MKRNGFVSSCFRFTWAAARTPAAPADGERGQRVNDRPAGSRARDGRPRIEGDREAEILDATVALLASAGYERLTMDAVATAAKASKATLYRRWSTKADLVIDAFERGRTRRTSPTSTPEACRAT